MTDLTEGTRVRVTRTFDGVIRTVGDHGLLVEHDDGYTSYVNTADRGVWVWDMTVCGEVRHATSIGTGPVVLHCNLLPGHDGGHAYAAVIP